MLPALGQRVVQNPAQVHHRSRHRRRYRHPRTAAAPRSGPLRRARCPACGRPHRAAGAGCGPPARRVPPPHRFTPSVDRRPLRLRLGAAANPWTSPWSSPSSPPKSTPTPPSTTAPGDTRCATSGCAWTSQRPKCPHSVRVSRPPPMTHQCNTGCNRRCNTRRVAPRVAGRADRQSRGEAGGARSVEVGSQASLDRLFTARAVDWLSDRLIFCPSLGVTRACQCPVCPGAPARGGTAAACRVARPEAAAREPTASDPSGVSPRHILTVRSGCPCRRPCVG